MVRTRAALALKLFRRVIAREKSISQLSDTSALCEICATGAAIFNAELVVLGAYILAFTPWVNGGAYCTLMRTTSALDLPEASMHEYGGHLMMICANSMLISLQGRSARGETRGDASR
jgi:hypothetical protein